LLTSLKDNEGKIISYCEWRLVGESGLEVPSGKYVWVNDFWVHEKYRNKNKVNRMIDEIMRIVPQAEYVYFQRKNVSDKIHIYSRSQMERKRNAYEVK